MKIILSLMCVLVLANANINSDLDFNMRGFGDNGGMSLSDIAGEATGSDCSCSSAITSAHDSIEEMAIDDFSKPVYNQTVELINAINESTKELRNRSVKLHDSSHYSDMNTLYKRATMLNSDITDKSIEELRLIIKRKKILETDALIYKSKK